FGELKLAPTADHPHPLGRGRASGLLAEHGQRDGNGRPAFPAQYHVVVQSTADDVQVRVVKTRNDPAALKIDDFGIRATLELNSVIDSDDTTSRDDDFLRLGMFRVERGNAAVLEDEIRYHNGVGVRPLVASATLG